MTTKQKIFKCADCGARKLIQRNGGTGYATVENDARVCYECCGIRDEASMVETGRATLYLTEKLLERGRSVPTVVTNWPGTLSLRVDRYRHGRHNICGTRTDVWFRHAGRRWHGAQYGHNTQICRCRRLKDGAR